MFSSNANIKVVGVGGGGVNAVDRMVQDGLVGVDFVAVNTDNQSLAKSEAETKLDIGRDISNGLGAGADPTVGRRAAEENADTIKETLKDADMVFVTAGEGGGTGTGAAPVVAQIARDLDILTIGVVTRPFTFEGRQRANNADAGIAALREAVDTLIVIPNDRLLQISEESLSVIEAYRLADQVLRSGVQGISDLITKPGLVNLDFADVKAIMKDAGTALMGIGVATGEDRAMRAAEMAISSPLLEARIDGARGVLLAYTVSESFGLNELAQASDLIKESVADDANIIFGVTFDDNVGDEVRLTVIAAGFDQENDYLLAQTKKHTPGEARHESRAKHVIADPASHSAEPASQPSQPAPQASTPVAPAPDVPVVPVQPAPQQPTSLDVPPTLEDEKFNRRPDLDIPDFLVNGN
ncbi:cell division protein FtsZ [Arcanobacterium phocisimile]|uniref:Cell division protein FtsZ n=1 Tax=Arcanobacterium phocisimile TaxID=1302235 RepID=A0ABX7IIJ1_9ACTO|nr:cell division protein FtsZ [Arcanobacterium phocisimile]QRV02777.1 cell division protein FtsZ [Arcanobacterium phocisimile]